MFFMFFFVCLFLRICVLCTWSCKNSPELLRGADLERIRTSLSWLVCSTKVKIFHFIKFRDMDFGFGLKRNWVIEVLYLDSHLRIRPTIGIIESSLFYLLWFHIEVRAKSLFVKCSFPWFSPFSKYLKEFKGWYLRLDFLETDSEIRNYVWKIHWGVVLWDTTIRKRGSLDWAAEVDLHCSCNWKLSCYYAKPWIWYKFYSCTYLSHGGWVLFFCINLFLSVGSSVAIGFPVAKAILSEGQSCELSAVNIPSSWSMCA